MRKVFISLFFVALTVTGFSQGLFHKVESFPVKGNTKEVTLNQKWEWRFDGTISLSEVLYNKDTKAFETNLVVGIGPAIGYQHYVPTSAADPTPFNNYGVSAALLLGDKMKIALQMNLMQYFRFGLTYTPKASTGIFPIGAFFGGGITF